LSSQPPDTRPIWPGRPELIYKRYLAEKEAWLASHPEIRPAQYRRARKLEQYSQRWCRQNKKFLPYQRLNLETETLIEGDPNWDIEELEAWLDHEKQADQDMEDQFERELIEAGGFGRVKTGGIRGIMGSVESDIRAEKVMYRFA
jgi:hypothetical protein